MRRQDHTEKATGERRAIDVPRLDAVNVTGYSMA